MKNYTFVDYATQAYIARGWSDFWGNERSYVDPRTGEVRSAPEDQMETRGQEVYDRRDGHLVGREPDIEDFMSGARPNIRFR